MSFELGRELLSNFILTFIVSPAVVIVFSIYIVYFAIVLFASLLLIRGTRKRDYALLMPFMILMAIGVFLSFLQLLVMGLAGLFVAIVSLAIDIYFFLCIYSLYSLLKDENLSRVAGPPAQVFPQQTTTVVYGQPQMVQYPGQQPQAVYIQQPQTFAPAYPMSQPQTFIVPAAPPMSPEADQQKASLP